MESVGRGACVVAVAALVGCGGGWSPTQTDPVTYNQVYMVGEVRRIEGVMKIGEFIARFEKPPAETYAGWAMCDPGKRPPFIVGFNEKYVEGLKDKGYMTALVAHEMCHHYVNVKEGKSCWDEVEAEKCVGRFS